MSRLLELLQTKAFKKKQVKLASGKESHFYIDVKRVSLMAEGAYWIGQELFDLIQKQYPEAQAAGGLTLGADPLATAVALTSWERKKPLQSFIVRKELKAHGLGKLVEGLDLIEKHSKVVILEDVVTSGGSSLECAQKLKDVGLEVIGICSVVDRDEGAKERIESEGYRLSSLYLKKDFGIVEE